MKKLFESPVVEVKSMSPETEVMGIFSVASSVGQDPATVVVVEDTTSVTDGESFSYWNAK